MDFCAAGKRMFARKLIFQVSGVGRRNVESLLSGCGITRQFSFGTPNLKNFCRSASTNFQRVTQNDVFTQRRSLFYLVALGIVGFGFSSALLLGIVDVKPVVMVHADDKSAEENGDKIDEKMLEENDEENIGEKADEIVDESSIANAGIFGKVIKGFTFRSLLADWIDWFYTVETPHETVELLPELVGGFELNLGKQRTLVIHLEQLLIFMKYDQGKKAWEFMCRPGALFFLERMKAAGYEIVIWSSEFQQAVLKLFRCGSI